MAVQSSLRQSIQGPYSPWLAKYFSKVWPKFPFLQFLLIVSPVELQNIFFFSLIFFFFFFFSFIFKVLFFPREPCCSSPGGALKSVLVCGAGSGSGSDWSDLAWTDNLPQMGTAELACVLDSDSCASMCQSVIPCSRGSCYCCAVCTPYAWWSARPFLLWGFCVAIPFTKGWW